jgi:acyl-CoA reductase-like NAD-dependent aldehyde dehydrogenase
LVTDPRVAFFSFIGSAKIGWWLRSQLAPGTRCALEHGGVAPVIVEEDADLDRIVPLLVKGGFYHAGQVCVSTQRIYAHKNIADKLTQALAEKIKCLKVGDATLPDTEVGPLISTKEVDRVDEWVKEAIAEGAEIVVGSGKISDTIYSPTLIKNPKATSKVSSSEVFGPVVCVTSYENVDEAIALANGLSVSFQASVCTQDIDKAFGIAKKINASAVMINDHTAFRVDWMPFAGYKTSGLGTGGIPHTMHEMTQEKMIVVHSPSL